MEGQKNELVAAARSGDGDSLYKLFSFYEEKLVAVIDRILPRPRKDNFSAPSDKYTGLDRQETSYQDQQDILQETFARALERITKLDPDREIYPWLVTICKNVTKEHIRGHILGRKTGLGPSAKDKGLGGDKSRYEKEFYTLAGEDDIIPRQGEIVTRFSHPCKLKRVEAVLQQKEVNAIVSKAVRTLDEDDQKIYAGLRSGASLTDIARSLLLPLTTIHYRVNELPGRIRRAIVKLGHKLEDL